MLETPSDFKFDSLPKLNPKEEFKIGINDIFSFRLFSNDGFKLVDMNINASSGGGGNGGGNASFIVSPDGTSKLPLLGLINLSGLTIRQAEDTLETIYSEFYVKPFVILSVSSRKIIYFGSGEGSARIIPLSGNSVSLIETIAQAGGLAGNSEAYSIKIIRGQSTNPKVYKVDLSTLESYKVCNIILQSNDIVYVDTRPRFISRLSGEILPYISFATTFLLVYYNFRRVSN